MVSTKDLFSGRARRSLCKCEFSKGYNLSVTLSEVARDVDQFWMNSEPRKNILSFSRFGDVTSDSVQVTKTICSRRYS
jgi:hypothetical protein